MSLDPAFADQENARMRREVLNQRIFEAQGGHVAKYLSAQFALTAGLAVYARMRGHGFRVFPLQASKSRNYLAIYGAAFAASWFGKSFAMQVVGDRKQFDYLNFNCSDIMSGAKPMDSAK